MASYEWVIEQEAPDGVTTRIVFDFADDEAERHGGRSRASASAASYHLHHRRDTRGRGGTSAFVGGISGGNVGAGSSGSASGATTGNGTSSFFFIKDATRSEGGGSSRRSSKHSNGSRRRRNGHHHPHHRAHHAVGGVLGSSATSGGASANGGGTGVAGGVGSSSSRGRMMPMATPTGSAYTSAALRQRYQRMLVGGSRGTVATSVAHRGGSGNGTQTSSTPSRDSLLNSGRPLDSAAHVESAELSASSHGPRGMLAGGVPPSTLFMSAYGAEVVEEDESQSSNSSPLCPGRLSHGSTGSSGISSLGGGGGGGGGGGVEAVKVRAADSGPWRSQSRAGASHRHSIPALHNRYQGQQEPHQSRGVSSAGAGLGVSAQRSEGQLEFFDHGTASHVTALKRRGRRGGVVGGTRVIAELCDEDDADDDDDEGDDEDESILHNTPSVDNKNNNSSGDGSYYVLRDVWAARVTCPRTVAARACASDFPAFPPLHPISVDEYDDGEQAHHARADTNGNWNTNGGTAPVLSNAVRDVFGGTEGITLPCSPTTHTWLAEAPVSPFLAGSSLNGHSSISGFGFPTSPSDSPLEHRQYNKKLLKKERQRRSGRGWQPILSYTSSSSTTAINTLHALPSSRQDQRQTRQHTTRGVPHQARAGTSTSDSSDADDESGSDAYDDDDTSSLECLSATSSDESDDAQGLCADARFAATVQSLASRAGRARRKMEAQEGAEEDAKERSSHAVSLRGGGGGGPQMSGLACGDADGASLASALRRGGSGSGSSAPSSFFISPIHQSVAAESAGWAAGTGVQFLGQGGLGGEAPGATSRAAPSLSSSEIRRRGGRTTGRRRGREEDNEEGDDVTEVHASVQQHQHPQEHHPGGERQRKSRKRRKKGDVVHQSVVGECGGSRALRPVAAPSNGPPLEILPSSKSDMREDLLESFLMEAVLDEDDFKLL